VLEDRARRLEHAGSSPALRDPAWILDRRRERLESAGRAVASVLGARVERSRTLVERSATRLARQAPGLVLARALARVESIAPRLRNAATARIETRTRRLDLCERSLSAISPLAVLARGYSITRRATGGAPIVDASSVPAGESIETLLSHGTLVSTVTASKAGRAAAQPE
jgi:exodeoxyribonuclease VII large subunit